jgi:acyl carrier protein phosphodiesterase
VIVDILYDHFLAKNWKDYYPTQLDEFVDNFYELLRNSYEILPNRIKRMMPYMISDNWLLSYATVPGISKILTQMNVRTKGVSKMNFAVLELEEFYGEFEAEFTDFFNDLIEHSKIKLSQL